MSTERDDRWFPPLAKRPKEAKMQIVKAVSSDIEKVLMTGDLSKLTSEQRVAYYNKTCESLGLNPLTRPFDYIRLNGKEVLYARKDATEQLRKIHGVSIRITKAESVGGVFVVVAEATDKNGRADSSTGAVPVDGLRGDNLANALMKAETKAKRRVTLSICGLGMLDETELETIPEARAQRQEKPVFETPAPQLEATEPSQEINEGLKQVGGECCAACGEPLKLSKHGLFCRNYELSPNCKKANRALNDARDKAKDSADGEALGNIKW